jgi:RHS repeat-associated protein
MPGDTINAEVYARYLAPTTTNTNVPAQILAAMLSAFGVSAASTGEGHLLYETLTEMSGANMLMASGSGVNPNVPKLYLNYLLFDDDFLPYDMGFDQVSVAGASAHEKLSVTVLAKKPGYAYIYFSNENGKVVEVYFDDFKVEHIKSPIIQSQDYYPFGLTFNGYSRENSVNNPYQYNGKEKQDEVDLGWYDFGWRNYLPELARWNAVDIAAEKYLEYSPYNYVVNNPILYFDPDGTWIPGKDGEPISWTVNEDKTITWSENTPDEFKKIGESLWTSEYGMNSLYAMSSSESKILISTNDTGNTTIESKGEIIINGDKYAEEINISVGVKDGGNYQDDLKMGAAVASQYLNQTDIHETLNEERIGNEFATNVPYSWGSDPWAPYPDRQLFENNSPSMNGRTGEEIPSKEFTPREQATLNLLNRRMHIQSMNSALQKRRSDN